MMKTPLLLAGAFLLVAVGPGGSEEEGGLASMVATVSLPAAEACNMHCDTNGCPAGQHQILVAPATHHADHTESCQAPGNCDSHKCDEVQAVPEPMASLLNGGPAFWRALETADSDVIRKFVENNPGRALLNRPRATLQVLGCADRVVANIPLTTEQLAELTSH